MNQGLHHARLQIALLFSSSERIDFSRNAVPQLDRPTSVAPESAHKPYKITRKSMSNQKGMHPNMPRWRNKGALGSHCTDMHGKLIVMFYAEHSESWSCISLSDPPKPLSAISLSKLTNEHGRYVFCMSFAESLASRDDDTIHRDALSIH